MRFSADSHLTFKHLDSAVNCHMYVVQTRSMDPSKDLSAYGYGSVAWKERVETWRQKQERLIKNEDGDKDWGNDGDRPDLPVPRQYGWPNTYVFTKVMGEMLISQLRGDLPVSIIRPYIITSTIREPFLGWIEGISHIDRLAIGYGKDKIPYFIGDPELVILLISIDMVANAMVVAAIFNANQPSQYICHAEDVFESLAISLMKLVGLKTEEMADEGRSSTILMDSTKH
ncbi:hypothetical protein GIB67_016576 [Kingdonia uniflora]|uniref:Fatty acyl-CoA reductase n=1 Tax=Kingdonia uniflora TaxID=39325 RepID=A0A7J7MZD5_9MAGN|nr:hypothetical protein GIB67_016576 [Kingdonia uniflora]